MGQPGSTLTFDLRRTRVRYSKDISFKLTGFLLEKRGRRTTSAPSARITRTQSVFHSPLAERQSRVDSRLCGLGRPAPTARHYSR
jgi:hypothetical protein